MLYILSFVLGAFSNRVRGGWIFRQYNRTYNALLFGIVLGLISGDILTGLLFAVAMFTGQSLGWGRYIGALGGWETNRLEEVFFIDALISSFKDKMRLWGFMGLTLRGILWGSCLALPVMSIIPVIGGALMGVCYWIAIKLFDRAGWEYAEFLFGGVLWVSVVYVLI